MAHKSPIEKAIAAVDREAATWDDEQLRKHPRHKRYRQRLERLLTQLTRAAETHDYWSGGALGRVGMMVLYVGKDAFDAMEQSERTELLSRDSLWQGYIERSRFYTDKCAHCIRRIVFLVPFLQAENFDFEKTEARMYKNFTMWHGWPWPDNFYRVKPRKQDEYDTMQQHLKFMRLLNQIDGGSLDRFLQSWHNFEELVM